MAIAREDETPLAFGGLWEGWKSPEGKVVRTFVIITTAANRGDGRFTQSDAAGAGTV
jgi:putative SOS response-associated peptidase YedK